MNKARAYYAPKEQADTGKQAQKAQPSKKKGIFRNRAIALLIAAVAVLGSTHAAVSNSLDELCWDTESIYYGGAYSEDTNSYEPALYDQLEMRYDAAQGIITAVQGYEGLNEACSEFEKAADQLYGAYTAHAEYYTNNQLQISYNSLLTAMDGVELSERDQKLFETYSSDFMGSQRMIEQAAVDYNEAVRLLQRELSGFPTNILIEWTDIEVPQFFE